MTDTASWGDVEEAATDKPMVYLDPDGTPIYRASALDSCPNALLAARHGMQGKPPPDWMAKRFKAGHKWEPIIGAELEDEHNFKLYGAQQEVELQAGAAKIRGHVDWLSDLTNVVLHTVDGVPSLASDWAQTGKLGVIDAKAFAQSTYEQWERGGLLAFPHYLIQQSTYDYALGFDGVVMAIKNKNTDDLRIDFYTTAWLLEHMPKMSILQKVLRIEAKYAEGPEALFRDECESMYPCPFWPYHKAKPKTGETVGDIIERDEAELLAFRDLAERRADAATREKAAKEEKDTADKDIAKFFKDTAGKYEFPDGYSVGGSFGSTAVTHWSQIAEACGMKDADEAKKRFTGKKTNSKMTVKISEPEKEV